MRLRRSAIKDKYIYRYKLNLDKDSDEYLWKVLSRDEEFCVELIDKINDSIHTEIFIEELIGG